jgi:mono/diheme cytochrome c family protein
MMSVYVELTLAISGAELVAAERTHYDCRMSRPEPRFSRPVRLLLIPALLFVSLSAAAFVLAKLHLAKPGLPKGNASVVLGDPYRGQVVFSQRCAVCHGTDGKGGGVGPRLQGDRISLAAIKAQIDSPRGTMPPNLVSGQKERDVLAFVSTIVASKR